MCSRIEDHGLLRDGERDEQRRAADTVTMTTTVRADGATRSATVLAVIVIAQLAWLGTMIYGISLVM